MLTIKSLEDLENMICDKCGENKIYAARGMCKECYNKWWTKTFSGFAKKYNNKAFKEQLNHLKFVIDEVERQGEKPTTIKIKPEIHKKLKCGLRSLEDITELFGLDVVIDNEALYDVVVV